MTIDEALEILSRTTNIGYGVVIENESTAKVNEALDMAKRALRDNTNK